VVAEITKNNGIPTPMAWTAAHIAI
jgi:hypothetical protein